MLLVLLGVKATLIGWLEVAPLPHAARPSVRRAITPEANAANNLFEDIAVL
jgi:hypothetical protein